MLNRRHTLAGLLGPAALFGLNGIAPPARGQTAAEVASGGADYTI